MQASLLREFTAFALKECRPRGIPRVLSRPQYRFETLLSSIALNMYWKELSGYKGNIPFYICTAVAPVIFRSFDTRDKSDKGPVRCFSSKTWRDQIKSIISAFADEHLLANYLGTSKHVR